VPLRPARSVGDDDAQGARMSQEIIGALKALKLHGMAANYPEVRAGTAHRLQPRSLPQQLLRPSRPSVRCAPWRTRWARPLPAHRDLAGFDFARPVWTSTGAQLHGGVFIEAAHNVVLIGGPGTGKTHLATASGSRRSSGTASGCASSRPWNWSTRWSWRRPGQGRADGPPADVHGPGHPR
jgi:hypothetical protein